MTIREMTISDIKDVVPLYVSYYNEYENGRIQEGSGLNILQNIFRYANQSMVEHSAVNRVVVGSSPTWGVKPAAEAAAKS